jgi:hypothetical protein
MLVSKTCKEISLNTFANRAVHGRKVRWELSPFYASAFKDELHSMPCKKQQLSASGAFSPSIKICIKALHIFLPPAARRRDIFCIDF